MKLVKYMASLMLVTLPSLSLAGSYQGQITSVFAYGGKVFLKVENGTWDDSNTCTGRNNRLDVWLDPATDFGKALLSIALVAKTTDKQVWVVGNARCSDEGPLGRTEQLIGMDLKG